ncbi:MAG: hypothetical protein FJZ01_24440 [Candidatus Sericytochromatia bacterium]|nr:hypothetical protein [Candidatus Tanganyikabacteria bacterium]
MTRRSVLGGLAGGGAALLAGSLPLSGCSAGPAEAPDFPLRFFSPEEYRTVARLCDVIAPGGHGAPAAADLAVARQADALLATLNPDIQEQVRQLLSVFEHWPILALQWRPFSAQGAEGALSYLTAWQQSPVTTLRVGAAALGRLIAGIYYADSRSWEAIGYEGVWIGTRGAPDGAGKDWPDLVNNNVYRKFNG